MVSGFVAGALTETGIAIAYEDAVSDMTHLQNQITKSTELP